MHFLFLYLQPKYRNHYFNLRQQQTKVASRTVPSPQQSWASYRIDREIGEPLGLLLDGEVLGLLEGASAGEALGDVVGEDGEEEGESLGAFRVRILVFVFCVNNF